MSSVEVESLNAIWQQVRDWPPDQRAALASRILSSLNTAPERRGRSVAHLLGLMASDQPPPNDEDVDSEVRVNSRRDAEAQ